LRLVPALEVLEWIDAPVLALSNDGTIPSPTGRSPT
jgi:hypothetical protein